MSAQYLAGGRVNPAPQWPLHLVRGFYSAILEVPLCGFTMTCVSIRLFRGHNYVCRLEPLGRCKQPLAHSRLWKVENSTLRRNPSLLADGIWPRSASAYYWVSFREGSTLGKESFSTMSNS